MLALPTSFFTPPSGSGWRHPGVWVAWLVAVTLMVVANLLDSAHVGRWALLVALLALGLLVSHVTHWAVATMIRAIAMFEGDVELDDDGRPRVTRMQDFARHRGDRERA